MLPSAKGADPGQQQPVTKFHGHYYSNLALEWSRGDRCVLRGRRWEEYCPLLNFV